MPAKTTAAKARPRRAASTQTAHEKGKALEHAIGAIEGAILRDNQHLAEKFCTIDLRRIIVVDGVKHEIDVWIEFDLGGSYTSLFIFEARNWAKTVGKDHIIVFGEKIKAANAQSGYFVAKSFSTYARAAAANNTRIRLLRATDDFVISDRVAHFHVAHQDQSKSVADFHLVVKGRPEQMPPAKFDMSVAILTHNGVEVVAADYANMLVRQMITEHSANVPSQFMASGVHMQDFSKTFSLAPGELFVDGYEVQAVQIKLQYPFEIFRLRIKSKFDIETRGRAYVFEDVAVGELARHQITMIERPDGRPSFVVNVSPPATKGGRSRAGARPGTRR